MDHIEIILVGINDVVELQLISIQTFAETFSGINTEENMDKYFKESFSIDKLTAELSNEFSQFYFAKINGEAIGYLKLNIGIAQKENAHENAVEIERIYVAKDFHGKNVGQLLYHKAIAVANDLKAEFVWLGVWEENFRALAFYKKNGFEQFDQHVFVLGDDKQLDILMKKTLGNS